MSASPWELVFQDNHSFMFVRAPHCPDCTRVLDDAYIDPDFALEPPHFDISVTSDGCVVVSDAFIHACAGIDGPRFAPIPAAPGFSVLHVDRIVRVEPFDSHVRTGPSCSTCDGPRYSVRSGPLHLFDDETLEPGFSRTDLEIGDTADFGSRHPIRFCPIIVVDEDTAMRLKGAELRGIHLITPP